MMQSALPAQPAPHTRSAAALRDAFVQLKRERQLRNRDAAQALGVSEGEALAAFVGEHVVRLDARFPAMFEDMPRLGRVMALTRNEAAVHEKDGEYAQMSHDGPVGLALGDIDLRIFYRHWASAFAVRDETAHGTLKSLQFFDAHGDAIHKVYLRAHSDHAAYDAFVERWRAPRQEPGLAVTPAVPKAPERADTEIDVAGFRAAWNAMTDTHQFFGITQRFGVSRLQALRLAEPQYAYPVDTRALRYVLEHAAGSGQPIMVFVGNAGMIQIHTGPVANVREMGTWINVLDPGFNLHVREDMIAAAWVVKKPTSDGIVTSVELFDRQGEHVALLFGERKPGRPERDDWRALVTGLPHTSRGDAQ
ncbi:hemin-degrading factor [Burkholderia stagnalis]|uniref:hemin-degrading factor n=1 Tax=Burkholderia stagnalis TaxID=1503054 RepID=UPI000F56CA81|nr:ChuX/HutX family heme-like substrate-binding protein [Burkholderia stagnalis]RQP99319.1 hemin-degrading factor [Burkholderia stagnalis]RQQ07788.1 hemin-degrading factor [Burkholderia stagnalis]RQQ22564.1 hemin-degrading factor [Burkholderia stagnalis]RQQ24823.1 hemin-degrading factor [Burkholderia stagnalis]RQQ25774.1 hemin-degrading factor [Burkholderia stagnalis]